MRVGISSREIGRRQDPKLGRRSFSTISLNSFCKIFSLIEEIKVSELTPNKPPTSIEFPVYRRPCVEKDIYCICLAHKLLSNVLQAKTVEGSTDRSKWQPVPFSDSDIIRIATAGWFQVEVSEVDPDGFPLFNLDCLLGVKIVGVWPFRIKVWRGQNSICFQPE